MRFALEKHHSNTSHYQTQHDLRSNEESSLPHGAVDKHEKPPGLREHKFRTDVNTDEVLPHHRCDGFHK